MDKGGRGVPRPHTGQLLIVIQYSKFYTDARQIFNVLKTTSGVKQDRVRCTYTTGK